MKQVTCVNDAVGVYAGSAVTNAMTVSAVRTVRLGLSVVMMKRTTMKSDAEIAREYWERWSKDHFTCETISPNDNDTALVRAGREAVLKQVVERGACKNDLAGRDTCIKSGFDERSLCDHCWAQAQLEGGEDAT